MPERKPKPVKKPAKVRAKSPEKTEPLKVDGSPKATGRTKSVGRSVEKKPKVKLAMNVKAEPVVLELTREAQVFRDKLQLCSPQEREFIKHKLARRNNTEAAILANYSERTAEEQGARLLGRVRVFEAFQAGLEAAGFGPKDVLDDIQALRTFDRSQIEREVQVKSVRVVQRPAEEVVQELITRERVTQDFIQTVKSAEHTDEALLKLLQRRLNGMLLRRLELEEQIALNPQALTAVEVEEVVTKRVIDYDLAKKKGLLRFIKGVKPSKFGDVIELHDWMDGVDMAARTHGLFKERHEHTGKDGGPIEADFKGIEALSGAALMDKYKQLLEEDGP